jgi:flagellar biosynthesis protein FlhF
MRLKSFYGPTLTDAMNAVREALGDRAIIVATRDDEAGGIRVTAAIDEKTTDANAATPQIALDQNGQGSELIEIIARALLEHQTTHTLAERLLSTATQFANEEPVVALAAAFDTHFRFAPLPDQGPCKPLLFVGPPGAGKTLCCAKLATKAIIEKRAVSVITTDTQRAGGIEQLAAFTRLLELDLIESEDPHALREAILMQPADSLIFIDSPGGNPFDESDRRATEALIAAAQGEATLVLPADMDSDEAIDAARLYQELGVNRLLFTRLDMTKRLGHLLRTSFETRLPLANYANTASVTLAPLPFNPVSMSRLLLPKELGLDIKATGTDTP